MRDIQVSARGLTPVAQRKVAVTELREYFREEGARIYNSPPDITGRNLAKIDRER